MRENADQRTIEEQLAKIASELRQIKVVVVVLFIVSPVGLYLLAPLWDLILALGVVGFWVIVAIAGGLIVLFCVARLTGLHKTLQLKRDELARILSEHNRRADDTRA
ncbi:MAG: hypothetical protein JW993_14405 [Sedimentisphaerales bacterium]|nr:hypothetical protein [Sedimentisphaerales bacterium]